MASDTEVLKRDIEQTRDELGTTLEAIGDRVAPKKVVGRVKENVSDKVEDVKDRVNPVRIARRTLRRRGSGNELESGDYNDNGRAVSNGSASARRRSRPPARTAAIGTGDDGSGVMTRARSVPSSVKATAQDNPLLAGIAAFGGGFLLAKRLPVNDRERQLTERMRTRLEPVKEKALETGRGMADDLKGVAQEGLSEVKQRATDAASQVKSEALVLAEQIRGEATASAGQVRDEAAGATKRVQRTAGAASRRVKAASGGAPTATTSRRRSSPGTAGAARRRTTTAAS